MSSHVCLPPLREMPLGHRFLFLSHQEGDFPLVLKIPRNTGITQQRPSILVSPFFNK